MKDVEGFTTRSLDMLHRKSGETESEMKIPEVLTTSGIYGTQSP